MKPKYHRFLRHLPATVFIAASLPTSSQADLLNVDDYGYITADGSNNGANTIIADGGTSPNPIATILSSASLTGDDGEDSSAIAVLEISDTGYTVNNDGSLSGTNHHGIYSTESFTLNNAGTIAGGISSGKHGVFSPNAIITNNADRTISGTEDGIHFSKDGGSITNYGIISGGTAGSSDGIRGRSDLVVINESGGSISGYQYGISANGNLSVTNKNGASITASSQDAVFINSGYSGGSVTNHGTITAIGGSSSDGIRGRNDLTVNNNTNFNFASVAVSGGSITGMQNGIYADDNLIVNNRNKASISGDAHGIYANDNAIITNYQGGSITSDGEDGIGVWLDASTENGKGIVNNYGDISGTSMGIRIGDNSVVTNSGTIRGNVGIDAYINTYASFTLNNTGLIEGYNGIAIDGGLGRDTINLNPGSLVIGDILLKSSGGEDDNVVNMTSGYDGEDIFSNVVMGGIHGRYDVDILNMDGGLTSILNFSGDENLEDYLESASGSDLNIVIGDVDYMQQINKTGNGVAFITGFDDGEDNGFDASVNVMADNINVTEGGLYINGDVVAARTYINELSQIHVGGEDGTEIGGTGKWDADVHLAANAGISAGQIAINLDWNLNDSSMLPEVIPFWVGPITAVPVVDPIGTLHVNGSLTLGEDAFIRYDLKPQLDTTFPIHGNGDADLIVHTSSYGGYVQFDEGSKVRLSPTSLASAVSDGEYVIVHSNVDIDGIPDADVGIQFNGNIQDGGIFHGSLVPHLVGTETANIYGTNLASFTELSIVDNYLNVMPYAKELDLGEDGQSLIATVQHNYEGLAGLSGNASSLGAALDASVNSEDELTQDFISALDYSDLETAQATLESLIPDGILGQVSTLVSSNYRIHRLAQDHLAQTRSGGMVVETPASTDAKGAVIPAQTTTSGGSKGNVWGTFSYDWKDSNYDNTDFDGQDGSFTAGADYRISADWLVGIMLDGSQGDYDYDGGSSDVDSFRVAVYGTYGRATGLYSDFLVGYGNHSIDAKRDLGGILSGTNADNSTDADSLQAMLTFGYAMQHENIKHGPFAGIEYQDIEVDGHTQKGAYPIKISDFDADSLRLLIGYRAEATYGKFTPYASVAYAYECENDSISTTATLPSGAKFDIDGAGLDSAILISIGTGYSFNPNLSMNIGYHGEICTGDGVDSNGGTIGLNYSF